MRMTKILTVCSEEEERQKKKSSLEAKMKVLNAIDGKTKDRLKIESEKGGMYEACFRWWGHLKMMPIKRSAKRRRPKNSLEDCLRRHGLSTVQTLMKEQRKR